MNLTNEIPALDRTIHSWGYNTVQQFATEQAKNILQQKIAYYNSKVDYFQQKYGFNFSEFCLKFNDIKNHSLFEKEDDSIIWETSEDVLLSYKTELEALIA